MLKRVPAFSEPPQGKALRLIFEHLGPPTSPSCWTALSVTHLYLQRLCFSYTRVLQDHGQVRGLLHFFFFFCSIFCNRVCCEATARRRERDTSTACSKTQPSCAVKATSKLPRLPQKGFQQEIFHLCKRKHIIYNIDTMKNNSRGGDVAQWLSAGPACRRPGLHAQHAGWRDNHGSANTQVVEDVKVYRCL